MRIILFERYRVWRLNRMPYPKVIELLRLGEGYIISNGRIIKYKM